MSNDLDSLYWFFDWVTSGQMIEGHGYRLFQKLYANHIEAAQAAPSDSMAFYFGKHRCNMLRKNLMPHFLRRAKTDCPADKLPKKTELVLWTHLSDQQRHLYDQYQAVQDDHSRMEDMSARIEAMSALKKICSHPLLYNLTPGALEEVLKFYPTDKLLEASEKLRLLHALVNKLHKEGHKTVIFSQSTQMLDIIEKTLETLKVQTTRIDGQVTEGKRRARVKEFNDKDSVVYTTMLCSTKAAGLGCVVCCLFHYLLCALIGSFSQPSLTPSTCSVTLTGADRAIIFDPSWTPAVDSQVRLTGLMEF